MNQVQSSSYIQRIDDYTQCHRMPHMDMKLTFARTPTSDGLRMVYLKTE